MKQRRKTPQQDLAEPSQAAPVVVSESGSAKGAVLPEGPTHTPPGDPSSLPPVLAAVSRSFDTDFSDVDVETGVDTAGGRAAAGDGWVAFSEPDPPPETVAHELAHVAQYENAGAGTTDVPAMSAPDDDAEVEAESVATRAAQGQPVSVSAAPDAATHREGGDQESPTAKIQRIIADEDAPGICRLTPEDFAVTTATQRAGMARILVDLWWTSQAEEEMIVALIEYGGTGDQVIALLGALGRIDALVATVDEPGLAARLATALGQQPEATPQASTAVQHALDTGDSDDVLAIDSFAGLNHRTLLSLMEILLATSWSGDAEEAAMLSILEQDVGGLMSDLTALGLKQLLFDHIDADASRERLTTLLQSLHDPELDLDILVLNSGGLGQAARAFLASFGRAWDNLDVGALVMGLLAPIIHPIDSALALLEEAANFTQAPSWDGFLALARDVTGTVAIWLLEVAAALGAVGGLLTLGTVTAPAGAALLAAGATVLGWSGSLGYAFVIIAGLKALLDLVEAGTATTSRDLEHQEEDLAQDVTLLSVVALFAAFVGALKLTLGYIRAPATDPKAADTSALERSAKDADAAKSKGDAKIAELEAAKDAKAGTGGTDLSGLTEPLKATRAGLANPEAIKGFDSTWEKCGKDPAKMTSIIESMKKGDLETALARVAEKAEAAKPKAPTGAAVAELPALKAALERLLADAQALAEQHPEISNVGQLISRIGDELEALRKMTDGQREATPERIAGAKGNIDGMRAELDAAIAERDVTGLGTKFPLEGEADPVDVDVVSEGGARWVEVKAVEPFGLQSSTWTALQTQILRLLRAASENPVDGAPPKIVVRFPRGVSWEVANALQQLGVEVIGDRVFMPEPAPILPLVPQDDDQ